MNPAVNITLNGDPSHLPDGLSVSQLLEHLGIPPVRVAVEINMDVVPKAQYDNHQIREGDVLEIVSFVGGG